VTEVKRPSLVKPTVNTPFHIDFDWWQQHDREWRVHLRSCLPPEKQEIASHSEDEQIDWVDPETAEVQRIDGLQHVLIQYAASDPNFITTRTTLVEAIFRTLLVNGNAPLTPAELGARLNRPATVTLRTIGGRKVYKGIRPCPECVQ